MELLILAIILAVVIKAVDVAQKNKKKSKKQQSAGKQEIDAVADMDADEDIDFANAYQQQMLFTKNEWQNYKVLKEAADEKGYIICPKVRLLDIVKPRSGEKKYKTLLYKIQSTHVDFVICDQNLKIKAIIELDDKSHDTEKGKERDAFVDTVLKGVGYTVIHTRYIEKDILESV